MDPALLGSRVSVYWQEEDEWYEGTLTETGRVPTEAEPEGPNVGYKVEYDDGDIGWIPGTQDLPRVRLLEEEEEASMEESCNPPRSQTLPEMHDFTPGAAVAQAFREALRTGGRGAGLTGEDFGAQDGVSSSLEDLLAEHLAQQAHLDSWDLAGPGEEKESSEFGTVLARTAAAAAMAMVENAGDGASEEDAVARAQAAFARFALLEDEEDLLSVEDKESSHEVSPVAHRDDAAGLDGDRRDWVTSSPLPDLAVPKPPLVPRSPPRPVAVDQEFQEGILRDLAAMPGGHGRTARQSAHPFHPTLVHGHVSSVRLPASPRSRDASAGGAFVSVRWLAIQPHPDPREGSHHPSVVVGSSGAPAHRPGRLALTRPSPGQEVTSVRSQVREWTLDPAVALPRCELPAGSELVIAVYEAQKAPSTGGRLLGEAVVRVAEVLAMDQGVVEGWVPIRARDGSSLLAAEGLPSAVLHLQLKASLDDHWQAEEQRADSPPRNHDPLRPKGGKPANQGRKAPQVQAKSDPPGKGKAQGKPIIILGHHWAARQKREQAKIRRENALIKERIARARREPLPTADDRRRPVDKPAQAVQVEFPEDFETLRATVNARAEAVAALEEEVRRLQAQTGHARVLADKRAGALAIVLRGELGDHRSAGVQEGEGKGPTRASVVEVYPPPLPQEELEALPEDDELRVCEDEYRTLYLQRETFLADQEASKAAYENSQAEATELRKRLEDARGVLELERAAGGALPPDHDLARARRDLELERVELEILKRRKKAVADALSGADEDAGECKASDSYSLKVRLRTELRQLKETLERKKGELREELRARDESQSAYKAGVQLDAEVRYKIAASRVAEASLRLQQRTQGEAAGQEWAELEAGRYAKARERVERSTKTAQRGV